MAHVQQLLHMSPRCLYLAGIVLVHFPMRSTIRWLGYHPRGYRVEAQAEMPDRQPCWRCIERYTRTHGFWLVISAIDRTLEGSNELEDKG